MEGVRHEREQVASVRVACVLSWRGCVQHLGVLTQGEYSAVENSYCQFFVEGSDWATCDGHRIDFPTLSSLFGNLTVLKPSK